MSEYKTKKEPELLDEDDPKSKVFNTPTLAVALKLEPEEYAGPLVVGSARGKLARKILEIAHEQKIPLIQDQALAESLSLLEVGTELPEELFPLIAEILNYLYTLSERHKEHPLV